jgi:hypothetical protein
MISASKRVHRSPHAAWREVDGEVAIISTDVSRVRLLNRVGGFVWRLCDGRAVDALVEGVREHYGLAEDIARRDVETFVEDLNARGLVVLEDP